MASHWKSTPSYWCKFCATYVRDSAIERKNHETSIKHQNNIQRSLRELHKTKEREDRDKQRAKNEVARLNGLVGGGRKAGEGSGGAVGAVGGTAPSNLDAAAQRKAHAEQLAAMGVQLPDELKKEVTGVGEWQTLSTRVIEDDQVSASNSLADILKQESVKKEEEEKNTIIKGVHKRTADEEEDLIAEERSKKKAAWGSRLKSYPGKDVEDDDGEDLDAILNGVSAKKKPIGTTDGGAMDEEIVDAAKKSPEDDKLAIASSEVKPEYPDEPEGALTAPPVPVFKKRKAKK